MKQFTLYGHLMNECLRASQAYPDCVLAVSPAVWAQLQKELAKFSINKTQSLSLHGVFVIERKECYHYYFMNRSLLQDELELSSNLSNARSAYSAVVEVLTNGKGDKKFTAIDCQRLWDNYVERKKDK